MAATLNRRFILRRRPGEGDFDPTVLERVTGPVPAPGPGQALVRNLYLSLDPTNRIWMSESDSYLPPVPLGDVMRGGGIGRVVASHTPKYQPGQVVGGMLNWQDYAVIGENDPIPAQVIPGWLPAPLTATLGVLGVTGMTAYFGLLDIGRPKRGETVFVSAAAGAVGSIVGQLAKIRGCRVVGIAGSRDKCDWLVNELGFDVAINRRDADWRDQLKRACPNGIDVNFENVGGEIMEAVMDLMNLQGRVVLCGMISQYNRVDRSNLGPKNFVEVLFKRLTIRGFIILDYVERFPVAQMKMLWWLKTGRLKDRSTIVRGLDAAPKALIQLFTGQNTGKLIVEIDDPQG